MKKYYAHALGLICAGLLMITCAVSFSACGIVPAEELYCLPEALEGNESLQNAFSEMAQEGYAFLSPTGGEHREPAERIDLDGDGKDEAVAFFRGADQSVLACVFSLEAETYRRIAEIHCEGSGISNVSYADVNGDGVQELLISCSVGETAPRLLQVYAVSESGATLLMQRLCGRYEIAKLNTDGNADLICLNVGKSTAEAIRCRFTGDRVLQSRSVTLSGTLEQLTELQSGCLADGTPALVLSFAEDTAVSTDILIAEADLLSKVTMPEEIQRVPALDGTLLYPSDNNADGYTEFPERCTLPGLSDKQETEYAVRWNHLSKNGEVFSCDARYFCLAWGWSLAIPECWIDTVSAVKSGSLEDGCYIQAVAFERMNGEQQLTVYRIEGEGCQQYAQDAELSVLYSGTGWVIAVALNESAEPWDGSLSLAQLSEGLKLEDTPEGS